MNMNKLKINPQQQQQELETKLNRIEKFLMNSMSFLSSLGISQDKERLSGDLRAEYKQLLQMREEMSLFYAANNQNKVLFDQKKRLDTIIERYRNTIVERLQKNFFLIVSQEERLKIKEGMKQVLIIFLAKMNEKKKIKVFSILIERVEDFKKRLEEKYQIIFPEHRQDLKLILEKIEKSSSEQELKQNFDELDKIEEIIDDINSIIYEVASFNQEQNDQKNEPGLENSRKSDKNYQSINKNYISELSNSEFPKREENGINFMLKMMETSFFNIPENSDYYPTETGKENNYPKSLFPKRKVLNEENFLKMDNDTLFFIFYFQKGSYEQLLAARALKNNYWRYHKKYMTWFKRLEEPREINEEFEKGTYALFDHEKGWCQRKKLDFTFKYHYLEDEI